MFLGVRDDEASVPVIMMKGARAKLIVTPDQLKFQTAFGLLKLKSSRKLVLPGFIGDELAERSRQFSGLFVLLQKEFVQLTNFTVFRIF